MGMNTSAVPKQKMQSLLERLGEIPTLPVVAMEVNELLNDPKSSLSDITRVLRGDQSLTAKILRLANSSYYAIPGGAKDIHRAVSFLGFNTVAQLVLGISVFSLFKKLDGEDVSMASFWRHALGVAICSDLIAKRIEHEKPEEAFTCGLLHDIGKLVLHEIDRASLYEIFKTARKRSTSFIEIEREREIPDHCTLGALMAETWGLPRTIQAAIRYHHFLDSEMDEVPEGDRQMTQIVRLSNGVCVRNQVGQSGDFSKGLVTQETIQDLGLTPTDLNEIETELQTDLEKAGAFLNVITQ